MVEPWCIGWKHRAHFWSLKSLASRTRSLLDACLFLPAIPRLLPPAVHAPCCVPCRCDAAGLLRRASPEGTAARQHHTPTLQERGIWWRSVGVHSRSYPEESGKGLSQIPPDLVV